MIKLQEMIYNPLRMVKAIRLTRVAALLLLLLFGSAELLAQANKVVNPTILYSGTPRKYIIGGINLTGIENQEPYVIIGLSNLSVGDEITVPGEAITAAVKRYWQFGLFSDVSITADSIIGSKIYLGIHLKQSPRVSQININGVKKSEREDIESQIGLFKGNQITPDMVSRAKRIIERYFEAKGYKNAEITILQRPDVNAENQMIVDVNIDKKEKIKINKIYINGLEALPDKKVHYAMKKTREKTTFKNFFHTFLRSKKFTKERYDEDYIALQRTRLPRCSYCVG